jgi:hypothetical protein
VNRQLHDSANLPPGKEGRTLTVVQLVKLAARIAAVGSLAVLFGEVVRNRYLMNAIKLYKYFIINIF